MIEADRQGFLGDRAVAPAHRPTFARLAVVAVIVSAAMLAGCGRKGALEPPPSAKAVDGEQGKTSKGPEKPNKPFGLDFLI
jgi:predicted small lipoprotein YifL